jgi:hypothetical protein
VFISENGIKFVRIDGSTLQRERKEAVDSFRLDPEVLPPTPPTHPFVVFSPLFLFHMSNNSKNWFNVHPFYTFYFQKR